MTTRDGKGGKGSNQYETKPPTQAREATRASSVPAEAYVNSDPFGGDDEPVEGPPVPAADYTAKLLDRVRSRRAEMMRGGPGPATAAA